MPDKKDPLQQAREEAAAKQAAQEENKKRKKKKNVDEEKKEDEAREAPPEPITLFLYETSIYDLIQSMEKMQDYDFTLLDLGIVSGDLSEELIKEGKLDPPPEPEQASEIHEAEPEMEESEEGSYYSDEEKVEETPVREPTPEPSVHNMYSEDDEYEAIVTDLTDLEVIPQPPEKAKNAFAVTLFCIESAFDSRARDFLRYAFDLFPDRDFLIVTQPHTVAESSLLSRFSQVKKRVSNTFSHVLYILHRDSLLDIDMFVRRAR